MALDSMTGFARTEGSLNQATWFWEIRSVNGRGLDVRTRFPAGFEALDPAIRAKASKRLTRGNVSATLNLRREATMSELKLNEQALDGVMQAAQTVRQRPEVCSETPLTVDVVLGLRGVLEAVEGELSEAERTALHEALLNSYDQVLDGLVKARREEGAQLEPVVTSQLDSIESLVEKIENSPVRTSEAIQARLKEKIDKLMETGHELEPARLHQEAVVLATRVDIEEELKRLKAHVVAARQLLQRDGAVGRKLDFLAQEFNREVNTICSKSYDASITQAGLELKVVIDQMREQVQNIE
ncbi:MAG: YicC/YloC family endoribonuclease [Hyphomicrobiaceae bacterium]